MAFDQFNPTIWSAFMLDLLHKTHVYGAICNRDYEGEIRESGSTVRIMNAGRPTIIDYVKDATVLAPETVRGAERELKIDRAKAFAFNVDDIDRAQSMGGAGLLARTLTEATYALAEELDKYVAGLYLPFVNGANYVKSAISPAVAFDSLVDLGVLLTNASVPTQGRVVVVPPWFYGFLQKDKRFTDFAASGTTETLRNGIVGSVVGFDVRVSNNVPSESISGKQYWYIMATNTTAITLAEQITSIEPFRPEKSFSDAIKGLHVYGAKIVRPDSVVIMRAEPTS